MADKWVLCPICGGKTRTKIRPYTVAKNLIVFCPKCKRESIVDINVEVKKYEYRCYDCNADSNANLFENCMSENAKKAERRRRSEEKEREK